MATQILNKMPPPPPVAKLDPALNRWFLDLQAFINSGGGTIDPSLIPGYDALIAQVNLQTTQINSLLVNTAANTASIHTLQTSVTTLNNSVATLATSVANLTARPIVRNGTAAPGVGLGNNGDWFADTNNLHIYVKVTGAWVLIV